MEDPKIGMLHFKDNRLDVKMTHPIFHYFMEAAMSLFREKGGVNFLSMRGQAGEDVFDIVIQKVGGKTPAERISELEQLIRDIDEAEIVPLDMVWEADNYRGERRTLNSRVRAALQPTRES